MKQPLAYIHPEAKIASNVVIEPFVTIDKNVVIGEGTHIGSNVTIMDVVPKITTVETAIAVLWALLFNTDSIPNTAAAPQMALPVEVNKAVSLSIFMDFQTLNLNNPATAQPVTGAAEQVRCLIIGSGPAGYTAAIYAGRANLAPVLYEGMQPGGQLTTTTEVENFPGYPAGVDGNQLMADLREQAGRFGADLRYGAATAADLSASPYKITIDGEKVIEAESVIIATGASAKYLGLPDEQKYAGSGVSACATCDGFFYRKKVVAVVGGGDTACEEALYLSHLAAKVYLIVRKSFLRASVIMRGISWPPVPCIGV